jgi:hypothetical protein
MPSSLSGLEPFRVILVSKIRILYLSFFVTGQISLPRVSLISILSSRQNNGHGCVYSQVAGSPLRRYSDCIFTVTSTIKDSLIV